ncbi:MAG: 23S rRNA (uracil(1939)-C(5))-methyltransferase RlmD, partial [Symbiobacteriaceae bacterium]|nr:23S rRNA (uracil(1939)-C(5))-methyltransferase RlmD [Symbiobacteriaceae bacterium]
MPEIKEAIWELQGDSLGQLGEGVARYQGVPVFVPGLLPGERALVAVTEQRQSFYRGTLHTLLQPSPLRRTPFCPHHDSCGGCQLQHWDYQAGLAWKIAQTQHSFLHLAKQQVEIASVIYSEQLQGVRNKVQLPCVAEASKLQIGFYAPRSHRLTPISHCSMQSPVANLALQSLVKILPQLGLTAYNEQTREGLLRHVMIRTNREDEQVLITLVINGNSLPRAELLVASLREALPQLVGVVLNINTQRSNTILSSREQLLWGSAKLRDSIGPYSFNISGSSFWQSNRFLTATLYETALQLASLSGNETVVEAYCGIGTISTYLTERAKEVYAIEYNPVAVADAQQNAAANGIHNVSFIPGSSEEQIPLLLQAGVRPHLVVVDPPRQGLKASLIQAIAAAQVPELLYISCNPVTLARDAGLLAGWQYHTTKLYP